MRNSWFCASFSFLYKLGRRYKLVSESFSGYFLQDVQLVVVSEGARQFLVGHARSALLLAPQFRQFVGIDDLERQSLSVFPGDALRSIAFQQFGQEFPEKPIGRR